MEKKEKHLLKKKYQIAVRRYYSKDFKSKKIDELTSTNKENFRLHINKFLLPEMTLENFGKFWSLDHIVPVELFDLNNTEDLKICYHFLNFMPMINNDNRLKGCSVHFSKEKLESLLKKETNENYKKIIQKLLEKCDEEISFRYAKYIM